jgi:acetyltransferase-like isoleucine patch superfamily enzyme
VVTKNVAPFSIAAGNPAKIIKQYNPETGKWERTM